MSIFMRCLTKMVITEYTQSFQTDRDAHTDRQMDRQMPGRTDGRPPVFTNDHLCG